MLQCIANEHSIPYQANSVDYTTIFSVSKIKSESLINLLDLVLFTLYRITFTVQYTCDSAQLAESRRSREAREADRAEEITGVMDSGLFVLYTYKKKYNIVLEYK
jgi:hypothetical protein